MFAKLESLERKYEELVRQLSEPDVLSDQERYRKLAKTHSDLGDVVAGYRQYKQIVKDLEDNQEMTQDPDPEIRELAQAETKALKETQAELEAKLKLLLLPKDPMDDKNILLEIRAGTGGEEAALFAGDLFRMYTRYAETKRWKVEIMSQSETGTGGFKEVIASISGDKVY
ncbi:MAG: PCRF domain-containing protein, partial [Acidobacteriota bacterium]